MLPSLFISHGSPALMLMTNKTARFLRNLPSTFAKPKYILVISAHWTSNKIEILSQQKNESLIYDFYGFPKELYEQEYPAKSDSSKENEIQKLLEDNGFKVSMNNERAGYDHGVWSPLAMMYPKADIPVIQISLPTNFSVKSLISLGEALIPLREDTLILGSGTLTHNLRRSDFYNENAEPETYAKEFRNWIVSKLENADEEALINIQNEAPYLWENHPTAEHLLPLFIIFGASKNRIGKSLHNVYMYGNQSMDNIIFEG